MVATSRMTDTARDTAREFGNDIGDQLADLRAQLDQLIEDKAMPMLNDARDGVREQVDALSGQVRAQPLAALAITAVVAFLAGRLFR